MPSRGQRTSRFVIFLRATLCGGCLLWIFFHALPFSGRNYVTAWSTWWFPFLLSACMMVPIGLYCIAVDYFVYGGLFGHEAEYQQLREQGWSPFWDRLPPPYNFDSEYTRQTGLAEPKQFVPPPHWQYQCPACGVRVEHAIDVCWNCNYRADGKVHPSLQPREE